MNLAEEFLKHGYIYISGEYVNYNSRFIVECVKCKTQKDTAWFYRHKKCASCYYSEMVDNLYEKICNKAASLNMQLYTDRTQFQNERTTLNLKCQNGHSIKTRWPTLKKLENCTYCERKNSSMSIENVPLKLMEFGWEYISGEYKNKQSIIVAKCSKGHIISKKYKEFRNGCIVCQPLNRISPLNELINCIIREGYKIIELPNGEIKVGTKFLVECRSGHRYLASRRSWLIDKTRCPKCSTIKNTSMGEKEILDWLKSFGVKVEENARILNNTEIDIYLPDHKLGIEFNGLYFHSEAHRPNNYHAKKYFLAIDCGISLLQFWEDEWYTSADIIKSMILLKIGYSNIIKVDARKCEIKRPGFIELKSFLDDNHLFGFAPNSASVGLYKDGELLQVLTLSYHHRNNKQITISRVCTKKFHLIRGGFSRLISKCPRPLLTWSDNRFSNGNIYEKLGFIKGSSLPPDYQYVKNGIRYSKQSLKKTVEEKQSSLSEGEIRKSQNYYRIFDAGKTQWLLQSPGE